MKLLGVIWNCSYFNKDLIMNDISKMATIKSVNSINLGNKLFQFITDFYNYPLNEKWKSDIKNKDLEIYSNKTICVIEMEIKSLNLAYNERKNKMVFKEIYMIKDYIRDKYNYSMVNGKVFNIYRENSFHLSDTDDEFKYQKSVVKKYLEELL